MNRYWKTILSEDNIAWDDLYRNPLAVYVISLTISAWIFAVETAADVRLEIQFFASRRRLKAATCFRKAQKSIWDISIPGRIYCPKHIY